MLSPGTCLQERYTIVRRLGQGGMGTVYLARHSALFDRPVAIKAVHLNDAAPPAWREKAVRDFRREALMLSQVSHPGLVEVTDFFVEDEQPYLVMAYVEGQNLQEILERGQEPPDVARVVSWMRQACEVVHYLHSHEPPIVVRDLKPSNLMLTPDERIVLIDFGLARWCEANRTATLVQFGGSPGFAPPEEYGEVPLDPRVDVYALGATLYNLLTGTRPPASVDLATGSRRLQEPAGIRPVLRLVMERAMALRRADRFATVAELELALAAGVQERRRQPRRAGRLRGATFPGLLVLLLTGTGLVAMPFSHSDAGPLEMGLRAMDDSVLGAGQGAVSADGRLAACCARDGVHVYDASTRHRLEVLPDPGASALALSSDGRLLATGFDGEAPPVHVWDVASHRLLRTLTGNRGSVLALAFDGAQVVAGTTCGFSGLVIDGDAAGQRSGHGVTHQPGLPVAFSPDARRGVWAQAHQGGLWDLASHLCLDSFTMADTPITCVTLGADGRQVYLGGADGTIRLCGRSWTAHGGAVESLVMTRGVLVSTGADREVRAWDVAHGRCLARLRHGPLLYNLAASADGHVVFACSYFGLQQVVLPELR
ncbi:MAG: WD40 repeat domain-containing serine/threonine protein kinase [Candidatus Xenobia bacterium]